MSNLARTTQPAPAPSTPAPTVRRIRAGERTVRPVDTRPANADEVAPSPTVCRAGDVAIGRQNGSRMVSRQTAAPIAEDRHATVSGSSNSRRGSRC